MPGPSTIFVIDDDDSIRRALGRVLISEGLAFEGYASVDAFIAGARLSAGGCIVADMNMPGLSVLDLRSLLQAAQSDLPIILLSSQDGDEARAEAMKAGAAAFFRKPVDAQALLDAVEWILSQPRTASMSEPLPPSAS